jgi:tetratricopeptide (TPR) repeat protein/spermidine synthase/MFS family permease
MASAAVMMIEVTAGALISRHVGMSLYTWTSIIGVVMAGMAVGNWAGGVLSDRYSPVRTLAILFLLAAGACVAVLPLNAFWGSLPFMADLSWPVRIVLHNVGVFFLPAMVLGAITPVVARLALQMRDDAGRTVGTIFAWGVAGSIAGTFITGYYLVYAFGTREVVLSGAAVMAALGLFYLVASLRHRAAAIERAIETPAARDALALLAAYATVFASNALFMMFELAAARVVSRQFGSSVYTWTAVIGIVLAGITLGNYLGGRLADRGASRSLIARLFLWASVLAALAPLLSKGLGYAFTESAQLGAISWPVQIVLYCIGAYFLPCVLIGTISPVVVKRLLDSGKAPGSAVGGVYAWGSAGGIVGTFATGFLLIDCLWSLPVLGLSAALMAVVGLAYAPRRLGLAGAWTLLLVGLFASAVSGVPALHGVAASVGLRTPLDPRVVYEDESQYSYLAVLADEENPRLREMVLDKLTHSQVDLDDPLALKYEYEWIYEAVLDTFYPDRAPINAMVIGGGGYAFPHYLEVARPGGYIETSEIDPAVTESAHAAFGLPRDTQVKIFDMDARNRVSDLIRLKQSGGEVPAFDCIMGDSINDYTVPRHLTTIEFVRQVHALLKDDGIYMLNMIDVLDSGLFLGAVLTTLREAFPVVEVFNTGRAPSVRDTFVVVCSKTPRDFSGIPARINEKHEYAGWQIPPEQQPGPEKHLLLTDNYAPVDLLLRPVVHTRQRDRGLDLYNEAYDAAAAGEIAKAIALAEEAATYHEQWPALYELMAALYDKEGKKPERLEALRRATDGSAQPAKAWYDYGVALFDLGKRNEGYGALGQAVALDPNYLSAHIALGEETLADGRADLAVRAWQTASLLAPDSLTVHYNLGLAYAGLQRFPDAIAAWQRAAAIDPNHLDSYHNLAVAFQITGQPEQSRNAIARIRALGGTPDPKLEAQVTAQ